MGIPKYFLPVVIKQGSGCKQQILPKNNRFLQKVPKGSQRTIDSSKRFPKVPKEQQTPPKGSQRFPKNNRHIDSGHAVLMTHCGDGVCRLLQNIPIDSGHAGACCADDSLLTKGSHRWRRCVQTFTNVIVNKTCSDKRFTSLATGCANVYECYCKQNVL